MAAVQAGTQDEVAGEQGLRAGENIEHFLLLGIHGVKPPTLLGFEVNEDEQMPDIAANSFAIAFGDWRRSYRIVDRLGVTVLRDQYTNKPYVMFYTRKRVGGGVQNFESYKLVKFGTS
jgi:HK97 family phage major capsid protein